MTSTTISSRATASEAGAGATTLTVAGARIYLAERGAGTPTLLLHGIFDSADTWQPLIERMPSGMHLLAPDLPGYGRSEVPQGFDCSLEAMADFVDELLAAAGIAEPVNLVAYDIGATYGLAWAVRHPAKVRGLAILNSNFFSDYQWHQLARMLRVPILGEMLLSMLSERSYVSNMVKSAPAITPEVARAAYRLITPAAKRISLKLYRATESANFRGWEDRLRELTARVPTIVLWGDRDPYIGPSYAERFGAREVHHFADRSHWLPLEAPDELAAHLTAFFAPAAPRD